MMNPKFGKKSAIKHERGCSPFGGKVKCVAKKGNGRDLKYCPWRGAVASLGNASLAEGPARSSEWTIIFGDNLFIYKLLI